MSAAPQVRDLTSELMAQVTEGHTRSHYLLGTGFPPGLPSGTRSGFTEPVAPPFAPYGLPAPGTATGALPVVVRGSVVWGWPVVGCPFLASGSRTRELWALAVAANNTVAAIKSYETFHRMHSL